MKLLLKVGCRCGQARPFPAMKLQDPKNGTVFYFPPIEYQLMNKRQPPGPLSPPRGLNTAANGRSSARPSCCATFCKGHSVGYCIGGEAAIGLRLVLLCVYVFYASTSRRCVSSIGPTTPRRLRSIMSSLA